MTKTILHFGLGAFHRAHQAIYTQDAGGWRIEAVSMRDPTLADAIEATPRYTLVTRGPDGATLRSIDVITRGLALSRGAAPIAGRIAAPEVHVITVTVTEKGYGLDRATGGPDRANPTMAHDLDHPEDPKGFVGTLLLGLARRQAAGGGPLTILSCDNLPDNGRMLESLVHETAKLSWPDLLPWIAASCTFPCTMVDRITPATTAATRALVQERLGQDDPLAVETEPFCQWVIEDAFAGPIPDWHTAGAEIVADVAPYEMMKLRMLNGAHSTLAYLGAVAGHAYVRDAMADPVIASHVRAVMAAAARTLPKDAGLDPDRYGAALVTRFENPAIAHACLQIAMDGSQKMPQRLFATARDLLAAGEDVAPLAQGTAAWLRFLRTAEDIADPLAGLLRDAARATDPVTALGQVPGLAGTDIFADARWTDAVRAAL